MSTSASQRKVNLAVGGDVQRGYKQTEIGVFPEDWSIMPISAIADVKTGPFGSALHERDYVNDGTPIITVEHLSEQRIIHENVPLVSDADRARLSSYGLREGDIVFSRVGSVDRNALVRNTEDGWLFSGRLLRIRILDNEVHPAYISYHFHSEPFKQRVRGVAVGQTMASLNTQILKGVCVVLPSRQEQHAIAEVLSDADRLIGTLEKLIAKKRAIKQAAMQQLLTGKTRLPGFTGNWKTVQLADIADKQVPFSFVGGPFGSNLKASEYTTFGVRIIQLQNIGDGVFNDDYAIFTSEEKADELKSCNIFPGEIIMSKMGDPVARACLMPSYDDRYLMASDGIRLAVDERRFSTLFALYYINFAWFRTKAIEASTGSTRLRISLIALKHLPFKAPGLEEQHAIASIFSDMDAEIAALERRRDKTKQIKQGMMQELLTGRVRLVKPQVPASEVGAESKGSKTHSWAFNEAVVIATLARHFGDAQYPLGRKRYTKLSYLLHRHAEKQTEGYLKKAAGPYNPKTRYGGPERIAIESGYVREHVRGPYRGFVVADNIAQAEGYFEKWYGPECIRWLEQFRYKNKEELELLATVDMAAEELRAADKDVDVTGVKNVIRSHPEWQAKLDRPVFSDTNIAGAIKTCRTLFG